jgi:metallo-beta-lactamase class B
MTRYLGYFARSLCGALLVAGWLSGDAKAQVSEAAAHVAAARAAVAPSGATPAHPFHVFQFVADQLCAEPKLPDQMRQDNRTAPRPRETWYRAPVRLFDNLYFIGTTNAGIYALNTSEGIILLDTSFHYNTEALVEELTQFGLDPNNIKYVIVSHGHDDRYFGASVLQKKYPSARIILSEQDWDVMAKDNNPPELKARKDMTVGDGQKLTLGDVTISFYLTPGHTPGTLSMIVEPLWNKTGPRPDQVRHVGAFWGGSDITIGRNGVRYAPDSVTLMNTWVRSIQRFQDIAAKAGADTILAQVTAQGNIEAKLKAWETMTTGQPAAEAKTLAGEPHPFISKEAVARYYTVHSECYQAQLAWRKAAGG